MDPRPLAAPDETAALVALLRVGTRSRTVYADLLDETKSPSTLLEEEQGLLACQLRDHAAAEIALWNDQGIHVTTLLDSDYPPNLRAVFDRPPLLFYRGRLESSDARSVAVIGSRRASPAGLERARAAAEALVGAGFTVVSGLAAGVDTAAHRAALERTSRTVAVIGTGVRHAYPPQNSRLQETIANEALVVSQFWPEAGPDRRNFPLRNAVMSGISLATFVVEATQTSGARTQVRAALAHGRPVLLADALLDQQWARALSTRPGVHVIRSTSELPGLLAQLTDTDAVVA